MAIVKIVKFIMSTRPPDLIYQIEDPRPRLKSGRDTLALFVYYVISQKSKGGFINS